MTIRQAVSSDTESIIRLILERMDWMEQNGIEQWNKTGYFLAYPAAYFHQKIVSGDFFAATENGIIVGAAALFLQDPRWNDGKKALYIHHLVASTAVPGAGKALLLFAQQLAVRQSIPLLRLDSQVGNQKLGDYYDAFGFCVVGTCTEGTYQGELREKRLDKLMGS